MLVHCPVTAGGTAHVQPLHVYPQLHNLDGTKGHVKQPTSQPFTRSVMPNNSLSFRKRSRAQKTKTYNREMKCKQKPARKNRKQ
ncbi:hypothetical protein BaRGS_00011367 [Batillaria attramentaria]|uniref:Uncharacterized protein n=1 Tax=Batillaria attramentaria TaxID=370345 RepID=A0ABD0LDC1_9CAEN